MTTSDDIATWFKDQRGIERNTLKCYGVKWDGRNVILPYSNGEKERPDPTQPLGDRRRFYFTKGVMPALFKSRGIQQFPPTGGTAFLVEGETDCMRLAQELDFDTPVYGLSGLNTWRPELAAELSQFERVNVILDNDSDYAARAELDRVWRNIRHDLSGRVRRLHLPNDVKDVCEFFDRYDLDTLRMLSERMSVSRYKPIDFNQSPPPVSWLLEDWIAMGDLTLLVGGGGIGKSWITMGLALAVINGSPSFMNQHVHESGPVLYVDEENPLDEIHRRLKRMGLSPSTMGQLRYLWNQGIRLDTDPDTLLDEALDLRPKAVILDSLTRLHGQEENSVGAMAPLLNDGIRPLAREAGAAVILIHHMDKAANGPRGSGDIRNSADAVIDVYDRGPGKFVLRLTKSRRRKTGDEILIELTDNPDGTLSIVVEPPFDPSNLVF